MFADVIPETRGVYWADGGQVKAVFQRMHIVTKRLLLLLLVLFFAR